jgi:hypothetical protein
MEPDRLLSWLLLAPEDLGGVAELGFGASGRVEEEGVLGRRAVPDRELVG